jgi:hypothetical protein
MIILYIYIYRHQQGAEGGTCVHQPNKIRVGCVLYIILYNHDTS